MEERELANDVKQPHYFERTSGFSVEDDEGNRDMGPLFPFIISGGSNTERYYFTHINDTTDYKFNIRPKYFADESNYIEAFPKRIKEILAANTDAKIFCIFDWDTIYDDKVKLEKHTSFESQFQAEISNGSVTICPSMPSIEYWFLLHFENYTDLLRGYPQVSNRLAHYIKPYFPDSSKSLKKLLKSEKYLKDSIWVKKLCADGKLEGAINRAEDNINEAEADNNLSNHSYSYVYKVFK